MFDINNIINAALTAAINSAVAPLNERIIALESVCATQHEAMVAMRDRITALENNPAQGVDTQAAPALDKEALINYLNQQEWFWDKLRNFIDAGIESAIDTHCETYDHDSYDNAVSTVEDTDFDAFVTHDTIEDAVRDAVRNLTFDISVS